MRTFALILVFCEVSAFASINDAAATLRRRVLEKSPDVATAQATLRQKRAAVHTSWARWIPRLDFQLSQTRSKDYSFLTSGALTLPTGFPQFSPSEVNLSAWALKATMPLFRRSVFLGVSQATDERDAAEKSLDVLVGDVDWRLRRLLGDYLLNAYKVATLANSLEMAKASSREAKLRFELGSRTRVDVLRANASALLLESKRLNYGQEKVAAWNALREWSGLSDAELAAMGIEKMLASEKAIDQAIEEFAAVDKTVAAVDGALKIAGGGEALDEPGRAALAKKVAEASPSARAIAAEQAAAESKAESFMSLEWPELALSGQIYKQAPNFGTAFAGGQQSFSIGVTLNIPLYLGGSLYSTARERSEAREVARLKGEKDLLHLRNEVESEWLQIAALRRSLESAQAAREQNDEIVRLSGRSYELGKTTMLELLTAQTDQLEAKVSLARTKLDLSVLARRYAANLGVSLP